MAKRKQARPTKAADVPVGDVFTYESQVMRMGHPSDTYAIVCRRVKEWDGARPIIDNSHNGHVLVDADATVTDHRPVTRAKQEGGDEVDPLRR